MSPKSFKNFKELFEEAEKSKTFWEQYAAMSFGCQVAKRLKELGLWLKDLKERSLLSDRQINSAMSGNKSINIMQMVDIAFELGCELNIELIPMQKSDHKPWDLYDHLEAK